MISRIFPCSSTLCLKTGIRVRVKNKKERKRTNGLIVGLFWVSRWADHLLHTRVFLDVIEIFWINDKTAAKGVNKIRDRNQLE